MCRCSNVDPWNALQSTSPRCFTLTVFAAVIPAWWGLSTVMEPCFTHQRITLSPSDLICHWMASKRQGIAVWCGGTEIPAASNLSIKAALAQRTASSEWFNDRIIHRDGNRGQGLGRCSVITTECCSTRRRGHEATAHSKLGGDLTFPPISR